MCGQPDDPSQHDVQPVNYGHVHNRLAHSQQFVVYDIRQELTAYMYRLSDRGLGYLLPEKFWRHWQSGYCGKELRDALPRGWHNVTILHDIIDRLDAAEHPWEGGKS